MNTLDDEAFQAYALLTKVRKTIVKKLQQNDLTYMNDLLEAEEEAEANFNALARRCLEVAIDKPIK